jgi:hypothetical protein
MPDPPKRRLQRRFSTPTPVVGVKPTRNEHLETPQRSADLAVTIFYQVKRIPSNCKEIEEVFGIAEASSSRIVSSKREGELQNLDEMDGRGPPRQFTAEEAEVFCWSTTSESTTPTFKYKLLLSVLRLGNMNENVTLVGSFLMAL